MPAEAGVVDACGGRKRHALPAARPACATIDPDRPNRPDRLYISTSRYPDAPTPRHPDRIALRKVHQFF